MYFEHKFGLIILLDFNFIFNCNTYSSNYIKFATSEPNMFFPIDCNVLTVLLHADIPRNAQRPARQLQGASVNQLLSCAVPLLHALSV